MPSSYTKCFFDGVVPTGNSGNFRPDTYDYSKSAERLIKNLNLSKSDNVLDLGCGNGLMADKILPYVKEMTLVEANVNLANFLVKKYPDGKPKIVASVSHNLIELEDNTFDKIICIAVLQYCDKQEAEMTVKECIRVCKKGGLIYFGDIFDSAVFNDERDGMCSFDPKFLGNGYNYKVILSNFEPERRYDLIIKK
jgi:ubiquinone/menaquinone biosynthesis C-methylase UbiE